MRRLIDLVLLDRLDNLIRMKATGPPKEFAKRLGISRSSLFDIISYLRIEMNAPIVYNHYSRSYEYQYIPMFNLGFGRDRLNESELNYNFAGEVVNKRINTTSNKKNNEFEIDNDDFILDDDIDFNDLYFD